MINNFRKSFTDNDFEVKTTTDGNEALRSILEDPPEMVLADANLNNLNAFDLLEKIEENEEVNKVPLIVFSQTGAKLHREKALELEAKDFIVGYSDSPRETAMRVKRHLGDEKAYIFKMISNPQAGAELAEDLGYGRETKCSSCEKDLSLYLLRRLELGGDIFQVSLFCPNCSKKYGESDKKAI